MNETKCNESDVDDDDDDDEEKCNAWKNCCPFWGAVMTNKKSENPKKNGKQETKQQQRWRDPNGKFCLISAPLKV